MTQSPAWNAESFTHEELRAGAGRYSPLFEPMKIGPKTAPNRLYGVPHTTGWGMDQVAFEAAHRRTRAEGGWGVVCTGFTQFDRRSEVGFISMLQLYDDGDIPAIATIADGIHEFGALAGLGLGHAGALAVPMGSRLPPVGVSQVMTDAMFFSAEIPQEMTHDDIRRVQDEWVAAARRGREAGFDIVYVQAAHSALAMQFLTPYYNHRTDEYGGSLENRARFLVETLERVREAVGDDTAVACRFSIESNGIGGIGIDEGLEAMRMADHAVDLWDLAVSGFTNSGRDITPSVLYPQGAALEWTSRAKEVTDKPVVGAGRFTDPDRMLEIVTSGTLDFIGAARPGIADPFMPRKIAADEAGRVRKCIGSNRCAISSAMNGNMGCSQNATTGEEHRRGWSPERFTPAANSDRKVLIVGAGPAGLECATVLARRGFTKVQIVEAAPDMGGHTRWFNQLPGFSEWGRLVEERRSIIEHTPEIEFIASTRLDADGVLDFGAEIVIVATGSHWATQADSFFTNTPIPGADASLDHVLTPEQFILDGKTVPGKRVVVYDCQADFLALGVVQYLQAQGHEVELASPFADIAMRSHSDGVSHALLGAIGAAGGRLRPSHFMVAVAPTGPVFLDATMSETPVEADATVLLARRSSDSELYTELFNMAQEREQAGIEALYRIGDCIAPQDLADAVFSGHRLAREIDEADPATPIPAVRV